MVSDDELVAAIAAVDHRPVATAQDVSSEVGMSDWGVRQRLQTLAETERIERARLENGQLIYWLSDSDSER